MDQLQQYKAQMKSEAGELIFPIGELVGRYRLESLIGSGGMGQVYLAYHLDLEEHFAIKAIRREFISSQPEVERFRREAQVARRLKHPNIVPIEDFNRHQEICYLRMPYLRGRKMGDKMAVSLDQVIRMGDGPPSIELTAQWLIDIVKGVSHAHKNGVIHRDLKPSNVLFDNEKALVSDFGLVRIVDEELLQTMIRLSVYRSQVIVPDEKGSGGKSTSSDSAMIGTYEFMAPECKDGEEANERSDLYAVGLIGLFMMTGRSTTGVGLPSKNFSWIPKQWDHFFEKTLSPSPDERFASAAELLDWLQEEQQKLGKRRGKTSAQGAQASGSQKRLAWLFLLIVISLIPAAWLLNNLYRNKAADPSGPERVETAPVPQSEFVAIEEPKGEVNALQLNQEQPPAPLEDEASQQDPISSEIPAKALPIAPEVQPDPVTEPITFSHLDTLSIPMPSGSGEVEFVFLEGGRYFYGSSINEPGRMVNEPEQEELEVDSGFFLGRFEVTQELYEQITGESPSRYPGSRNPVNNISFSEIFSFLQAFNKYLAQLDTGFPIEATLPSQFEWEYAARAGSRGPYGLNEADEKISPDSLKSHAAFDVDKPMPVGSLKPNKWGLFDMHGNIEECTLDGIVRGGSFESRSNYIRCSSRGINIGSIGADGRWNGSRKDGRIGFRLKLAMKEKS